MSDYYRQITKWARKELRRINFIPPYFNPYKKKWKKYKTNKYK